VCRDPSVVTYYTVSNTTLVCRLASSRRRFTVGNARVTVPSCGTSSADDGNYTTSNQKLGAPRASSTPFANRVIISSFVYICAAVRQASRSWVNRSPS
jgi:hypothetical protein